MVAFKWIVCLGCCLCLAGCSQTSIVNKIKLAQTISYDLEGDGVKSTLLFPLFENKNVMKMVRLDTVSNSFYDIIPRMNTKTNAPIEYGQLKMVLFGKEYSERGLEAIIHSLCRDPEIGSWLQLGVADADASAILKLHEKSQIPYFIHGMVEQNRRNGNLPVTNLQTFLYHFYGAGSDAYLPYFKIESGDIKIDGLALFRNDQYVTHIDMKETFLLKTLIEDSEGGHYTMPIEGTEPSRGRLILLNSIHSKTAYRVAATKPVPSLAIQVKLDAQVKDVPEEMRRDRNSDPEALVGQLEAHFTREIEKLIAFCQKNKVDPIGFGERVKKRDRAWNEQEFLERYPEMKTKVDVKVRLVQTGVDD